MHPYSILAAAVVAAVLFPQEARAFSRAPFLLSPITKLRQNHHYPSFSQLNLYVETDKYPTASRPNAAPTPTVKTLEEYVKDRGGNRVIKKVLIANNGMAATKSIISMRRWAYMELGNENAIHFVAMATPEDIRSNAEFVRLADSFVEVPGGKNLNNYANVTVISQVAKEQGVDAVWPGMYQEG
jgi:acetyl-CoA carboxylase/biotin carboxylase 1